MSVTSLEDLFLHTLKDIYYAEKQIVKALPKMAKKAGSAELKAAFESHLEETRGHVTNLENVFSAIGKKPSAVKCDAIVGILHEATELMDEVEDEATLDAAMLAAAQAVEHYEIARYGSLIAWAGVLGHKDAVKPLQDTLAEEKAADAKLSKLGKSAVNKEAA
ncbi:ferritin-like domain-containing protein [Jiella endophytica]|uniref:Ferritin-like domain-containing protein n=1 Tax=Jiella endophytica TaxID=2558362 RepID=A0A4Y8RJG5_9HYPH|nr:ferritin-like domain-containing protein [Jiella endophytica]TFF22882.1 ferritin-like domain-containing protein [Jiella endophytica]